MNNKTAGIIVASMFGVTFVGMGVWLSSRATSKNLPVAYQADSPDNTAEVEPGGPEQAKLLPLAIPKPKIPAFRVITNEIAYDNPRRSQVEITVFMEKRVTEEGIRILLHHLYRLAMKAGPFRYRQHPNYVYVYVHAKKGQDWIGMGSKSATSDFDIHVRKELLKTANDPSIIRFGLTEKERQMIWRDMVRVEDRANREAEELYPFPMQRNDPGYTETGESHQLKKQLDYARELEKQYRGELAESLGLTIAQLGSITMEGAKNSWETPPVR